MKNHARLKRAGAQLAKWRAAKGYSQRKVAALLGCTQQAVCLIERGKREPQTLAGMICRCTGIPLGAWR